MFDFSFDDLKNSNDLQKNFNRIKIFDNFIEIQFVNVCQHRLEHYKFLINSTNDIQNIKSRTVLYHHINKIFFEIFEIENYSKKLNIFVSNNGIYTSDFKTLLLGCSGTIIIDNCEQLGYNSLSHTKLRHLILLDNIKAIGENALSDSSDLEYVDLANTKIKKIPNSCFANNLKLKKIIFPKTVTTIEYEAFYKCSLLEYLDFSSSMILKFDPFSILQCHNLKIIKTSCSYSKMMIKKAVDSIGLNKQIQVI